MTLNQSALSVHDFVEENYEPVIFWGNQEAVVQAVRACAFSATMPYIEVSASAILPSGVEILFNHADELPAWHLFTDFSSADPSVQTAIMRNILSRDLEMATDVVGVFVIASTDAMTEDDAGSAVCKLVRDAAVAKFHHVRVDPVAVTHPFPVG